MICPINRPEIRAEIDKKVKKSILDSGMFSTEDYVSFIPEPGLDTDSVISKINSEWGSSVVSYPDEKGFSEVNIPEELVEEYYTIMPPMVGDVPKTEQQREELLQEASTLVGDVKGLYGYILSDNLEGGLSELAFQAHSSAYERRGAIKTAGPRLIRIATLLFPESRPTSDSHYKLSLASRIAGLHGLNDDELEELRDDIKKASPFEYVSALVEATPLAGQLESILDAFSEKFNSVDSTNEFITTNKNTVLKSLSNLRNQKGQVTVLLKTVESTSNVLDDISRKMDAALKIANEDERMLAAFNLYTTAKSFSDVVNLVSSVKSKLQANAVQDADNRVLATFNNVLLKYNAIVNNYLVNMSPLFAKSLATRSEAYTGIQEIKNKLLAEEKALIDQIKVETLPKKKKHLNAKLKRVRTDLTKVPTEEYFLNALLGKEEEISGLSLWAVSRADLSSGLVQAIQGLANRQNMMVNQQTQVNANKWSKIYKSFLDAIGKGISNPKEIFNRIVKTSKIIDGFDESGDPVYVNQDILLNQATPEFFATYTNLNKQIQNLWLLSSKTKDITEKQALTRQREELELERARFLINYTNTTLSDEWLQLETLTKAELMDGKSFNELTHNLIPLMQSAQKTLGSSTYVSSVREAANTMVEVNKQIRHILAGLSEPVGSEEYVVAKRLEEILALRGTMGESSISETAANSFNQSYKYFKKQYNRDKSSATNITTFLLRYADLNNTNNNDALQSLYAEFGDVYEDAFLQIQAILSVYRDNSGNVNGNAISPEDSAELARLEALLNAARHDLTLNGEVENVLTTHYHEIMSDKINELTLTLMPSFNTEEEARLAARDAIKSTVWYEQNHTNDVPNPQWYQSFVLTDDVLDSFTPNTAYEAFEFFPKHVEDADTYNNGIPKVKNDPSNPYLDQDYIKLSNSTNPVDEQYFKFLQQYTEDYLKAQDTYSQRARNGFFLPSIRKTSYERNGDLLRDVITDPMEALKRRLSDSQANAQVKEDMYGGNDKIPIRYSSTIDTEDQSKDLVGMLLLFNHASDKYKALREIEPIMVGAKDMIEANGTVEINSVKNSLFGAITGLYASIAGKETQTGELDSTSSKPGISNVSKAIEFAIKEELYGNYNDTEIIPILGGIDANNLAKNIMQLSSFGTFAMNAYSPLKNALGADVQSLIFASHIDKGLMNYADIAKAKSTFILNQHVFAKDLMNFGDKSLISQLVRHLDLLQGDITDEYGKTTQFNAFKSGISILTVFKNYHEWEIQMTQALAFLHAKKVEHNGKMVSLLDAYELDGQGNVKLKDGVKFDQDQEFSFAQKVQFYQRQMNGALRRSERASGQRGAMGKLLFFMNQYFVPMFNARFRGRYFNSQKGDFEQGFYLLASRMFYEGVRDYKFNIKRQWSDMTIEQKEAVMRTTKELLLVALLGLAAMAMGFGGGAERRKKNSVTENYILALLVGAFSESRSFIYPADIYNKLNNPFFALRPVGTLLKIFGYGFLTLLNSDDAYYSKDAGFWDKGDSKALAEMARLFGFTGNQLDADTLVKNMEGALKIRN